MKIKTSELTGVALDWAVAKCLACDLAGSFLDGVIAHPDYAKYHPSSDWAQGGPIIEREKINVTLLDDSEPVIWAACYADPFGSRRRAGISLYGKTGSTPLIAAMRCFVASRLGDEVDVPDELA